MSRHGEDSLGSSDLVLRCYAPLVLAHAYRRLRDPTGTENEKLGRRLGFVDTTLRFLVGVLACELFGRGLEAPDDYAQLIAKKLQTPSWGDWSRAAEALARRLDGVTDLVAPDLVSVLVRGGERTDAAAAFRRFVDTRNAVFHQQVPVPSETRAEELNREDRSPLNTILRALQGVSRYSLLYVEDWIDDDAGTALYGKVLRLTGDAPDRVRVSKGNLLVQDVPRRQPFLVSASGDALLLKPFFRVAQDPNTGELDLVLLRRWDADAKAFCYTSSHRGGESLDRPAEREQVRDPSALLDLTRMRLHRKGVIDATIARELLLPAEESIDLPGYVLDGVIGCGASGVVFRAKKKLLDRPPSGTVAVKVLHAAVMQDASQRTRMRREYETLAQLQSRFIVKVFDYAEHPRPFIVMEYIAGEDLRALVERRPLAPDDAARVCLDVLEALSAAHVRGIVHRDIKPSNVMRDRQKQIRVVDFGIAAVSAPASLTRTFDALGTFEFAAPEQMTRDPLVDHRADIYSVGRLFEFLVNGSVGLACQADPALPPGVHAIVRKATNRRPADRFADCAEMRAAIRERMDARWAGAPVQSGDHLNESYALGALAAHREGVWAFEGVEVATDDPVTLLVAPRSSASGGAHRLVHAVRSLPDRVRVQLGSPRVNNAGPLLYFAVLARGDTGALLDSVLDGTPPRTPAPARNFQDPPAALPLCLGGFWTRVEALRAARYVNALDVLALAEHARRALLVVCAQIASSRGELSPDTWPRFTAYTLGTACELFARFSATAAELRSGIPFWDAAAAAIRELTRLQKLRNEIAHRGAGDDLHAIEPFLPGLAAIYELGTELGSRVSGDSLRFVIDLDGSGEWCLLDPASSKPRYIGLADLRFEVPVTAHRLADWEIARAGRDPVASATPPYLRALYGFWDAPADDASAQKQVTRRLCWLAFICIAQLTARAPLPERLRSWRAAQGAAGSSLFSHVESALADHPSVPSDLRRRVADLFSVLTSAPSASRSEARGVFDLSVALGAVATDGALSPFVREVAPSSWGLLRIGDGGSWPRVVLLSTGETIDAPRDAEWVDDVARALETFGHP